MKKFFFLIVLLANTWQLAISGVPPRLLPNVVEVLQVVPSGKTAELSCPVEANQKKLYVEWFRNGHQIDDIDLINDRVKIIRNKILRIHPTILEDSGKYMCRAINGFGTVETNVTLTVIGAAGQADESSHSSYANLLGPKRTREENTIDTEASSTLDNGGAPPSFVSMGSGHVALHSPSVNSSLRLDCMATGSPKPRIKWLKDGVYLLPNAPSSEEGTSSRGTKRSAQRMVGGPTGRWTLHLKRMQFDDSGNYTCIVFNQKGTIKATFVVKVKASNSNAQKLVFDSGYPRNTVAIVGQPAVLQCRIRSTTRPHLWWLKRTNWKSVKHPRDGDSTCFPGSVSVDGKCYTILSSTKNPEHQNGVYVATFRIAVSSESDDGIYGCMAATNNGYIHQTAFLKVVSINVSGSSSQSGAVYSSSEKVSFWKYVRIPLAVLLVTAVLLLVRVCYSRMSTSASAVSYGVISKDQHVENVTDATVNGWDSSANGMTDEVTGSKCSQCNCAESLDVAADSSKPCSCSSLAGENHSHVHHHEHVHYVYDRQ